MRKLTRFKCLAIGAMVGCSLLLGAGSAEAAFSKGKGPKIAAAAKKLAKEKSKNRTVSIPVLAPSVITAVPEVPAAVPVGAAILVAAAASRLLRRRQSAS